MPGGSHYRVTQLTGSSDKPFAPSASRLAAAGRAGFFPTSPLLVSGAVLLVIALFLHLSAPGCAAAMSTAFASAMENGFTPEAAASALLSSLATFVAPLLFVVLIIGGAVSLLPALIARRRGATAVPLPRQIPVRRDGVLVGLLCLLAAVPMTILAVRSAGFHFEEIQLDPVAATRRFIGFVATLLAVFGTSAAAGGILQLSLYRVRLLRELSLDRSDLKREQRLHEGPGNRQG